MRLWFSTSPAFGLLRIIIRRFLRPSLGFSRTFSQGLFVLGLLAVWVKSVVWHVLVRIVGVIRIVGLGDVRLRIVLRALGIVIMWTMIRIL